MRWGDGLPAAVAWRPPSPGRGIQHTSPVKIDGQSHAVLAVLPLLPVEDGGDSREQQFSQFSLLIVARRVVGGWNKGRLRGGEEGGGRGDGERKENGGGEQGWGDKESKGEDC